MSGCANPNGRGRGGGQIEPTKFLSFKYERSAERTVIKSESKKRLNPP